MAIAGHRSMMILAAFLLISIHMGNMHDIYSALDFTAEHSYTGEHLHQLRQKRAVNTDAVEYIAVAELTTHTLNTVDTLIYINSLGFPRNIQNSTEVIDLNITTVCQQDGNLTQCKCEDSYVWTYNNCLTYQTCDYIYVGTCGCISGVPSGGQMCIPKSELPVIDFTIQIETNASTAMVNSLKNYVQSFNFPYALGAVMEISMVNLTTECGLIGTEYQCKCEDQYFWPCNTCMSYGYCDSITNNTCGCINGFQTNGPYCQPITEINSTGCADPVEYIAWAELTTQTLITSDMAKSFLDFMGVPIVLENSTEIVGLNITTECSLIGTGYQCKCENQYFWPCNTCMSYTYCDSITNNTCGCINGVPMSGPYCQPITEISSAACAVSTTPVSTTPTIPVSTTPAIPVSTTPVTPVSTAPVSSGSTTPIQTATGITRTISMTIDEAFDSTLTQTNSQKYQTYRSDIASSVDSAYQKRLSSYEAGSAKVTQFLPGSVIAYFTIVTTDNIADFSAANTLLASVLSLKGYQVSAASFAEMVENGLYNQNNSKIYPGKNMVLTCNPPNTDISWSINSNSIGASSKYQISADRKTLTVTSTNDGDSGKYACTTTVHSMPYIIWQRMTVLPLPSVNVNASKTLKCDGSSITLQCYADTNYTVQWSLTSGNGSQQLTDQQAGHNICTYPGSSVGDCKNSDKILTFVCEVRELSGELYTSNLVTLNVTSKALYCYDNRFGAGNLNDIQYSACDADSVGNMTAQCIYNNTNNGDWKIVENNCILRVLQNLLERAQSLRPEGIPQFVADLQNVSKAFADKITGSPLNTLTTVNLLNIIANVSQSIKIGQPIMTNFLEILDVIGSANAQETWLQLNQQNSTQKASAKLLKSTEDMGSTLTDESFRITTNSTQLNRNRTNSAFSGTFGINSTTQIDIPELNGQTSITTIVFLTLDNVLPIRNTTYNNGTNTAKLNGDVAAVLVNNTVHNISLTFDIKNTSLGSPQCVFWNFNLLDGIGGWDSTGCEVKPVVNQTNKFKCECNHTTSFSILMSPFYVDNLALAFITYIGVSISILCLILALIIEIIVWKPLTKNDTSYMRHVSLVNIALSLLIADICFIIGAASVKEGQKTPVGPCSTATFFMHFFYLALFFWMLFSALLLFYRTVMVFSRTSKCVMMVIAIILGYGAPLLIAVITVASTAGGGGYIQEENACWLNWTKTKAMLAFVIPALTIVAINLLVLLVVVCKMLRRGVGATTQPEEKHALVVIARCVAILTPLFGLTWGFGIGTMVTSALGIHIVFAILNSLQGFFIFVFGVLMDSKIRKELVGKLTPRSSSSMQTRSTSAGVSSSSGLGIFERIRRRNMYNVSNTGGLPTSSLNDSDTYNNT